VSISSIAVNSGTEMTIGYSIGDGAAPGVRDLTLSSTVQGAAPASFGSALTITSSPSIISVSPRSIISGSERQITITGRNFYEGGATVTVSPATGVTVTNPVVVNSGQILATIAVDSGAQADLRTISVTNADGGQCAVATFNAAIQIVIPPQVASFKYTKPQLRIIGSNFHPSIQAYVGGSTAPWPKITVRKNSTLILGGAQKTFPKGASVTVRLVNPDDGGETTITVTR
jgi:LysM repeat protein